jgi:hypothetical protein
VADDAVYDFHIPFLLEFEGLHDVAVHDAHYGVARKSILQVWCVLSEFFYHKLAKSFIESISARRPSYKVSEGEASVYV